MSHVVHWFTHLATSIDDPFSNAYEQPPGKRVNLFQEDLTMCAFSLVKST